MTARIFKAGLDRRLDASIYCSFDRAERSTHLLPWTRESSAARAALEAFCQRHTDAHRTRTRAAA